VQIKIKVCFLLFLGLIFINCQSSDDVANINKDNTSDAVVETIPIKIKTEAEINEELKKLHMRQKEKYLIKIGDVFDVYVDADPNFNTLGAIVKTDGKLSLKVLGEIEVEGLTIDEAKDTVEVALRRYIRIMPRLSLIPVKIKSAQVSLLGEVVKPGLYDINADMCVLDVISAAGGVAKLQLQNEQVDIADIDNAYIVRDNKILPVNFNELLIKGNQLHNILLKDKDYIYIPSLASKQVFVLGEVGAPGKYMLSKNLTLSKVIAQAGGKNISSGINVLVIRGNLKKPTIYRINISSVLLSGKSDFLLKPDDVVYLPRSPIYVYNDVINNILPTLNLVNSASSTWLNVANMRDKIKQYHDNTSDIYTR